MMAPAASLRTAGLGQSGSGRLVVKFTFLDVVDDAAEPQPSMVRRACTDSALWKSACGALPDYLPGSLLSEHSEGSETDDAHRPPAAVAEERHCAGSRARDGRGQAKPHADMRTTLMLRNLPNNYTRDMLLEMLDGDGFAGAYDFVYLPMDFARGCGLGYAFVNLVSHDLVPKFRAVFEGYSDWALPTSKVCQVNWSDPHQGLNANLKRYRHSPVMHASVPDEYKPCLFLEGKRVAFPAPSGRLCRPHRKA